MPLEKRIVEPVNVSQCPVPAGHTDDLEFVASATFANLIRQMASLCRHACDIFDELSNQATDLNQRSKDLAERIKRLKSRSFEENVSSSTVPAAPPMNKKTFVANFTLDHRIISRTKIPTYLLNAYNNASPPPPLHLLNPYRDDGLDCTKFYTDSEFFFKLWSESVMNVKSSSNKFPPLGSNAKIRTAAAVFQPLAMLLKDSQKISVIKVIDDKNVVQILLCHVHASCDFLNCKQSKTIATESTYKAVSHFSKSTRKYNSLRSMAARNKPPSACALFDAASFHGLSIEKETEVYEKSGNQQQQKNSDRLIDQSNLDVMPNKTTHLSRTINEDRSFCHSLDRRNYRLKSQKPNVHPPSHYGASVYYGERMNEEITRRRSELLQDYVFCEADKSSSADPVSSKVKSCGSTSLTTSEYVDGGGDLKASDFKTETKQRRSTNFYSNDNFSNSMNNELCRMNAQFDKLRIGNHPSENRVDFSHDGATEMCRIRQSSENPSRTIYDDLPLPAPELFEPSPSRNTTTTTKHTIRKCDNREYVSGSVASEYRPLYMRDLHSDLLDEIRKGFKLRKVEKDIEAAAEKPDRLDVHSVMEQALKLRRKHTQPESSSDSDSSWRSFYS